jgi:hypothetical protein
MTNQPTLPSLTPEQHIQLALSGLLTEQKNLDTQRTKLNARILELRKLAGAKVNGQAQVIRTAAPLERQRHENRERPKRTMTAAHKRRISLAQKRRYEQRAQAGKAAKSRK